MPSIRWYEIAVSFGLMSGCNAACAATSVPVEQIPLTLTAMTAGPFAGWAIVTAPELPDAWPMLVFATASTHVPLAIYFTSRSAPPTALGFACLAWLFWGFWFAIGAWI